MEYAKLTAEAGFLSKYQPPKYIKEIRAEQEKARNYEVNNLKFKEKVPVNVGNAYLLRSINFEDTDILVYLKIHRQNEDGSLIIFWQSLKEFETPFILRQTDEELSAKVKKILAERKFDNISFDVKDNVVTLRGSVSQNRLAEAIRSVYETKPLKIINHLSRQD